MYAPYSSCMLCLCHDLVWCAAKHPSRYAELLALPAPMEEVIQRDINRTFPTHVFFRELDGMGQRTLLRVLKAYSVHNPAVGYCQGMGFITGLLLLHMKEEDAFWLLTRLTSAPLYDMEGLFKDKLPKLNEDLDVFEKLTLKFLPAVFDHILWLTFLTAIVAHFQVHSHLEAAGIHVSMYATEWFVTIFTSSFPFRSVLRIWDIFLHTGQKVHHMPHAPSAQFIDCFDRLCSVLHSRCLKNRKTAYCRWISRPS